ncbi:MAG: glycosyltransferase [Spirochaetia bacterium]|nr:glycosyltransferase [Spirochaetia bacterium]
MKISILMSLASPWSRLIAEKLSGLNNQVQIIDFETGGAKQYLKKNDSIQITEVDRLYQTVDRVDIIHSRVKSKLKYILYPFKLRTLLKDFGSDVLFSLYGGGYGTMAYLSRFHPYVVYIVGSDIMVMNFFKKIATRIMLKNAEIVFVNGKFLAGKTRDVCPSANIVPCYIGMDSEIFKPSKKKSSKIKIICTRGFLPIYNNAYIIDSISKLENSSLEYEMIFTSKGPLLEDVKQYADEILTPEIRKKLFFLGGVTNEKLVQFLQSADIYLSMSRSDGTSISMLEAMSCGLYPILSDIPQNREWLLEDNLSLVPLDQPEIFAQILGDVMKDIVNKRKAAQVNRKLIQDFADINVNMRFLTDQLQSLKLS